MTILILTLAEGNNQREKYLKGRIEILLLCGWSLIELKPYEQHKMLKLSITWPESRMVQVYNLISWIESENNLMGWSWTINLVRLLANGLLSLFFPPSPSWDQLLNMHWDAQRRMPRKTQQLVLVGRKKIHWLVAYKYMLTNLERFMLFINIYALYKSMLTRD